MNARFFLDTNILVYSFDATAPLKRQRARELISTGLSGLGAISFQVVQEFLNVALRRFARPMSAQEARIYLDEVLVPLCQVQSDPDLYREALEIHARWGFSLYDAQLVAAALRAGCETLFSEDLQNGQQLGGLRVVNPFV